MITINKIDFNRVPREITDFAPLECIECDFDGHIPIQYYLVKEEINSEGDYQRLTDTIQKQLGYSIFNMISSELGQLISVCRCPECGSEEIFSDY